MYVSRLLKWKKLITFKDFALEFCKYVNRTLKDQVARIDFVFDSYLEFSIKNGERLYRYGEKSINLNDILEDTPMSVQEKLFWSSNSNKSIASKIYKKIYYKEQK